MAEFKNIKTGLVWDITDPAMLKMVKSDSGTFQPVVKTPKGKKDVTVDDTVGTPAN